MWTIILLFSFTIICFTATWLVDKYTYADLTAAVLFGVGILNLCALIVTVGLLININKRFDAFVFQYETTVEMVDSYAGKEYGNMSSLVKQVVQINNTIVRHKAHHNSKWVGLWYSERIGNLEPIKFNRNIPTSELI